MSNNNEKTCSLTIYVDRPAMMVPKKFKRKRPNAPINEARLSGVGHVFLGLTDEKGEEKRIGFYAKSYALGAENIDPIDRINGPHDALKKVAGIVQDETHRRYHDAIQYKISKKQYDDAVGFTEKWKKEDPKYVLLANNCASFAIKTARNVGLRPPAQLLLGIPSPHGTSLAIQLKNKIDNIANLAYDIAKKLSSFFGGKGSVIQIGAPDFIQKTSGFLKAATQKAVSETTFGFIDANGKTTVKSEGVSDNLSHTLPNKDLYPTKKPNKTPVIKKLKSKLAR